MNPSSTRVLGSRENQYCFAPYYFGRTEIITRCVCRSHTLLDLLLIILQRLSFHLWIVTVLIFQVELVFVVEFNRTLSNPFENVDCALKICFISGCGDRHLAQKEDRGAEYTSGPDLCAEVRRISQVIDVFVQTDRTIGFRRKPTVSTGFLRLQLELVEL